MLTTFVSAKGQDSNSCGFSSPCRTLQGAYAKTAPTGEIDVLDPAGYGSLTIDHSISVRGHGFAHVAVPSTTAGISINATPPQNPTVNLSGLIFDGLGRGARGIMFNGVGAALTVTDCVIRNVTGNGIEFAATSANSKLAVSDTLIENTGNNGILITPGSSEQAVALTRVQVYSNTNDGVVVVGGTGKGVGVTVTESALQGNNGTAVHVIGADLGLGAANVLVVGSAISVNGNGLISEGGSARLFVARSALMGNEKTWSAHGGGAVLSFGNNDIAGNFDSDPAPPVISLQ